MLKLTGRINGETVYVAIPHITVIDSDGEGASIWTVGATGHIPVKETPEQIMAMPEMLDHLHPPMTVYAGFDPKGTSAGLGGQK